MIYMTLTRELTFTYYNSHSLYKNPNLKWMFSFLSLKAVLILKISWTVSLCIHVYPPPPHPLGPWIDLKWSNPLTYWHFYRGYIYQKHMISTWLNLFGVSKIFHMGENRITQRIWDCYKILTCNICVSLNWVSLLSLLFKCTYCYISLY